MILLPTMVNVWMMSIMMYLVVTSLALIIPLVPSNAVNALLSYPLY